MLDTIFKMSNTSVMDTNNDKQETAFAFYYATRNNRFLVMSKTNPAPIDAKQHRVKNIYEARRIAKEFGAKPSNF